MQFHHVGVPSTTPRAGEQYLEGPKVYVTDPSADPFNFEYVRFEADTPLPAALQEGPHVAFSVANLEQAMAGLEVVIPPFDATPTIKAAFVRKDGTLLELMQIA